MLESWDCTFFKQPYIHQQYIFFTIFQFLWLSTGYCCSGWYLKVLWKKWIAVESLGYRSRKRCRWNFDAKCPKLRRFFSIIFLTGCAKIFETNINILVLNHRASLSPSTIDTNRTVACILFMEEILARKLPIACDVSRLFRAFSNTYCKLYAKFSFYFGIILLSNRILCKRGVTEKPSDLQSSRYAYKTRDDQR